MLYIKMTGVHLKSQMQYRLSFFLTTLGQFITSFTAFFGISFMFSRFHAVEGFTYEEVLLCFSVVVMAFSLGEMAGGDFAAFPSMIGNGEFDRALVRPRSLLMQVLAPKMDFTRLGLLLQAVLVLCYAVPKSGVAWTWGKALTLCTMILSGSILFFSLFLIYAACAFFTLEGLEFFNFFTYGGRKFGNYPFSIYGKNALFFLTFVIPLALFQYYPLLYLLDRERSALFALLPLVGMLFLAPSYALFRLGLRHYKSTGS